MLLVANSITFQYSSSTKQSLHEVSMAMDVGEICVLAGPSGCGKSTLAKIIAGLLPNSKDTYSGSVVYNDVNIEHLKSYQRTKTCAIMLQDSNSSFLMSTLREELKFVCRNIGIEEEDTLIRINELQSSLPIIQILDIPFVSLSEGEKQLAYISTILITKAPLIILDEPFAHMNDELADKLVVYLYILVRKDECGIVVVDHMIERWIDIANEVILLTKDGTMAASGISKSSFSFYEELCEELGVILPFHRSIRRYHEVNSDKSLLFEDVSLWKKESTEFLLEDVAYNIPKGNIISIVGDSGCGKTTLLEAIANGDGYEGVIYYEGKDIHRMSRRKRMKYITYISQNCGDIFFSNSVFDEVFETLRIAYPKENKDTIKKLSEMAIEELGLKDRMHSSPYELSVGQQRYLMLHLAFLQNRPVLLVDEPTFGQDARSLKLLMNELVKMKEQGISVIFTTHNKDVAVEYSDVMLRFDNHKLVEVR